MLPVSATSIGEVAFSFCGSLTSINISASITLCSNRLQRALSGSASMEGFSNIIEMTTGISEEQASLIKIYPNPVAARFRITGLDEKAVLSIVDMNGKVFLCKQITGHEAVSVEELPKGVYVARIVTSMGTIERKLLKE